jgi:hypothetical protein
MKNLPLSVLVTCLCAGAGAHRMTGWVSDAGCGATHTKPGGADCIKKCIRGGEKINPAWKPQKMVLVSDAGREIWTVENPSALTGLEGQHVAIDTERGKDAHSIVVKSAEALEPGK